MHDFSAQGSSALIHTVANCLIPQDTIKEDISKL